MCRSTGWGNNGFAMFTALDRSKISSTGGLNFHLILVCADMPRSSCRSSTSTSGPACHSIRWC